MRKIKKIFWSGLALSMLLVGTTNMVSALQGDSNGNTYDTSLGDGQRNNDGSMKIGGSSVLSGGSILERSAYTAERWKKNNSYIYFYPKYEQWSSQRTDIYNS